MRVYYDDDAGCIFIEGVRQPFPPLSLMVEEFEDDGIKIWTRFVEALDSDQYRVAGPVSFGKVNRRDGTGFSSRQEATDYLVGEFQKYPERNSITNVFNTVNINITVIRF